jgi:hypothetical protein
MIPADFKDTFKEFASITRWIETRSESRYRKTKCPICGHRLWSSDGEELSCLVCGQATMFLCQNKISTDVCSEVLDSTNRSPDSHICKECWDNLYPPEVRVNRSMMAETVDYDIPFGGVG